MITCALPVSTINTTMRDLFEIIRILPLIGSWLNPPGSLTLANPKAHRPLCVGLPDRSSCAIIHFPGEQLSTSGESLSISRSSHNICRERYLPKHQG
jgi:hypothetical protein